MWVQVVWYILFPIAFVLLDFSLLILSLPFFHWDSKSTCLCSGFSVQRPRQYNMICWLFELFSGFFVSSWLIDWTDGVNECSWCLAGSRESWLKGLYQIPSVSCLFHHYFSFQFIRLPHLCKGNHDHCVVTANSESIGMLGDSFMLGFGCGDREGVCTIFLYFFLLFLICR